MRATPPVSSVGYNRSVVSDQVKHGRFYTPDAVADLVVAVTLGERWPPKRVLDPTCGDGAMLGAALRRGLPATSLVGRDTDPVGLALASARLPDASFVRADLFDSQPADLFDAIIGNPPYVRSDRVDKATKDRAASSLGPSAAAVIRRGDLAACALWQSALLLSPGGRLGFVVSAALLDADYAQPMWAALESLGSVREIVAAPGERWFPNAAVNTVIVVFQRSGHNAVARTRVSRLHRGTAECARVVRNASDLNAVADTWDATGAGSRRWSHLLRAPRLWLALEESKVLTTLGDVADLRRGMTTGANDVFYLSADKAREASLERSVLSPLVRSPPKASAVTISIEPSELADFVLRAPIELDALPNTRRYLESHRARATQPTVAARNPWWRLPDRGARLFLAKAYAQRFVQRYSLVDLDYDQRVYAVLPHPGVDVELLAAILNGTLTSLAIEALGRASMGEGALEWTVKDARTLPIIDPRLVNADLARVITDRFRKLATRPIRSCQDEVGRADRRALDELLLSVGSDPALSSSLDELAPALARASALRENRAQSIDLVETD